LIRTLVYNLPGNLTAHPRIYLRDPRLLRCAESSKQAAETLGLTFVYDYLKSTNQAAET
jgi:hypothetical protein